jgi:MFS family permease
MLSSARVIGLLLLAVPAAMALAVSQFPSYDARSRYFAASYHNIVEASRGYVVALGLFLLVAAILVALAFGLWQSPLRTAPGFLMVVVGGLGAAAVGFALAAITGLPVWWWARQVAEGSLSVAEGRSRSADLAPISQTALLMLGLGGFLVGMSALGVAAVVLRWVPRLVFWLTLGLAVVAVVVALVTDGPAIWIGFGLLPILWAITFGFVLLVRGDFRMRGGRPSDGETASP